MTARNSCEPDVSYRTYQTSPGRVQKMRQISADRSDVLSYHRHSACESSISCPHHKHTTTAA